MSDYNDIYLLPRDGMSRISSRSQVTLKGKDGMYPFISSPMKGISGAKLVIEMGKNNCWGILHRFSSYAYRVLQIAEISKTNVPFGVAIGMAETEEDFKYELDIAKCAVKAGAQIICLDVANGYLPQFYDRGRRLRNLFPYIRLMSGNVITVEGSDYLNECGFDMIRVGIGGGSNCATRMVTGVGRNQLPALKECSRTGAMIVSDGGITVPANAVKSFVFGADYCMMGTALANSIEAENDGFLYGMASKENHILNDKTIKSIEGFTTEIDNSKKLPLKEILNQFIWGVRSACTYLDCHSIQELSYKPRIVSVNEQGGTIGI